jgi:transcriptional regulator with XRE-family HTH domain
MGGECSISTKLDYLELISAILHITVMLSSEQCRAARALLNWTQEDLAVRAGVSRSTVRGFERGEHELQRASAAMIRMTLEQAGVILIEADEQGAGARLQSPHRPDQSDAR